MPRKDTNDNRYNRQTPNNTEIVHVRVETIMGMKVESFVIEDKADIIAAKAKKPTRSRKHKEPNHHEGAWTADWPVTKYSKTGYTKSGTNREEVIEDVTAVIRRKVILWHLREHFEIQAAQKSIREMRAANKQPTPPKTTLPVRPEPKLNWWEIVIANLHLKIEFLEAKLTKPRKSRVNDNQLSLF